MPISKKLKEARVAAGYTQAQVATIFGISREAVALWESSGTSSTKPDIRKLQKLADLYKISVSELLGAENSEVGTSEASTIPKDFTEEEKHILWLMGHINKDARQAWIRIGDLLSSLPPDASKGDSESNVNRMERIFNSKGIMEPSEKPKGHRKPKRI